LKKNGNTVVDTSILIPVLNVTALVAIMLSMGLRVKVEEVVASARSARRLVLGLVANYMIVPGIAVVAYGLVSTLGALGFALGIAAIPKETSNQVEQSKES
jgi:predicted Na+-dependent transporter